MPVASRPSGASIVASAEFVSDYTALFEKKWLNTTEADVGYPSEFPVERLQGRNATAKL